MHISNELRVGIMFFVGLVLLVLLIVTLTRWGQDRNAYAFTIRFTQASGIPQGADVRVAGVKVGQVTQVGLDQKTNVALVTVRVDKRVMLFSGYDYTIGIGGLVGERFLDIRPTANGGTVVAAGSVIDGNSSSDFGELITKASKIADDLSVSVQSFNTIFGDRANQENLRLMLADLRKTARSSSEFAEVLNLMMRRNQRKVDLIAAELLKVAGDIRRTSDHLLPQLAETQLFENLDVASGNVVDITERLSNIAALAEEMLGDPTVSANLKEAVTHLKQASAELDGMMADTRKAMAPFAHVTANLEKASADLPEITRPFKEVAPETAENLKSLSVNLRQTSENVGTVAQQVGKIGSTLSALEIKPEARLLLGQGTPRTRSDVNVDLYGQATKFRLGVADIGNGSTLNAQMGNRVGDNLWLRYGIVQSTLGAGADYRPNANWQVSGDLFDPNRLRANLFVDYRVQPLGSNLWFTAGWYDALRDGKWGAGVTYRP